MKKLSFCLIVLIAILTVSSVSANELNETSSVVDETDLLQLDGDTVSSEVLSNPNETESQLTLKSTINANDINMYYKDGTKFAASFYDYQGSPLAGYDVKMILNGVEYTRTTDYQGTASIAINLNPGYYQIEVKNPLTQDSNKYSIYIKNIVSENKDLVKYYKNSSAYVVKLLDNNGNAVSSGIPIVYNINGVFYTRYTDSTGHVKLNINLRPGNYIITGEYKGYKFSNNVRVLTTLSANDLSMTYKDGSAFEAVLLDGQGRRFSNENVQFNINGVFYTRTTNSNGVVKLNINLMPGDYIITTMHNGLSISNTIHIKSASNSGTNTNTDDGLVYIDLPSYDTTTKVKKGKYTIEVQEWRSPSLGEVDIMVYDSNNNMVNRYSIESYISDGSTWSNAYSAYERAMYHKWQFSPSVRITKVAVKLNGISWY